MSAADPQPRDATKTETREVDITHTVCCQDPVGTRALCGIDVTDDPWTPEAHENCVVCEDISAHSDECPFFGTCRDLEDDA